MGKKLYTRRKFLGAFGSALVLLISGGTRARSKPSKGRGKPTPIKPPLMPNAYVVTRPRLLPGEVS